MTRGGATVDEPVRRWWPDLLAGGVGIGVGLATTLLGWSYTPGRSTAVALAVLAGVTLVGVRRWPWPVLLLGCGLLVVTDQVAPTGTSTVAMVVLVALGRIAYRAGWRSIVAAFVLSYVGGLINAWDAGDADVLDGGAGVIRMTLLAGAVASPIVFGRYLRGLWEAARVAQERAAEAEARREVETRAARLAERASFARDLHDIVAHHVGAMALQAGAGEYAVRQTGHVEEAARILGELHVNARRVLDELRELLAVLRDPEAVGTGPPLVEPEELIMAAQRRLEAAGVDVRVNLTDTLATAPLVVRTTAARVVQEGMTNLLKHAGPGASASVAVRAEGNGLLVEVTDTGPSGGLAPVVRPPSALPPSGHGLTGIRERIRLLGGSVTAGPKGDGGWRLRVYLPLREAR